MKRLLLMIVALVALAGCSDTVHSKYKYICHPNKADQRIEFMRQCINVDPVAANLNEAVEHCVIQTQERFCQKKLYFYYFSFGGGSSEIYTCQVAQTYEEKRVCASEELPDE